MKLIGTYGKSIPIIGLLLGVAFIISGCVSGAAIKAKVGEKVLGIVEKDLMAGYELALLNEDILGTEDAWGLCYKTVADNIKKTSSTDDSGDGKLFYLAMRLHILSKMKEGVTDAVKDACGEVFIDIMLTAAKKIPGM